MLRSLMKNRKGQNTAEYALLIALVVAGIVAMQQYAQRALQARVRDASVYMANTGDVGVLGNTVQYEPYYQQSNYEINRVSSETERQDTTTVAKDIKNDRERGGSSATSYGNFTSIDNTSAMPQGL